MPTRAASSRRLTKAEKQGIVDHCIRLDQIATRVRDSGIVGFANSILARNFDSGLDDEKLPPCPPVVGKSWPHRFLERHKKLSLDIEHSIELLRATAEVPDIFEKVFDKSEAEIDEYNILAANQWNFDELGIIMSQRRLQKVIVEAASQQMGKGKR